MEEKRIGERGRKGLATDIQTWQNLPFISLAYPNWVLLTAYRRTGRARYGLTGPLKSDHQFITSVSWVNSKGHLKLYTFFRKPYFHGLACLVWHLPMNVIFRVSRLFPSYTHRCLSSKRTYWNSHCQLVFLCFISSVDSAGPFMQPNHLGTKVW